MPDWSPGVTGTPRPAPARRWHRPRLVNYSVRAVAVAGFVVAAAVITSAVPALGTGGQAIPARTGFGAAVTVYHGNALGTGLENPTTALRPLRPLWRSPKLDGDLFGEPLVYGGVVFAATENDTVYGVAADSGSVLWSIHIAAPVPTRDLSCGDISPTVGVTGTPVIDPARHEIFVVADELEGSGASHYLVGLDISSGRIELNEAVNPPRSIPTALLQRSGLTLDEGRVIIGFGGNYGDCGTYHGTVAAVPEGGGVPKYYVADGAADEREGAVWMGGGAPLVDADGNIWFSVGNGSESNPPYDYSDSVIELSSSLRRRQFFAPTSWAQDNRTDADLGSTPPAFVGNYVLQVGKGHIGYLMNRNHLGGIGGQVAEMPLCNKDPDGGLAVHGSIIYVPCGDGVTAVRITDRAPYMSVLWTAPATNGVPINGPPIFASGLVWSLDAYGTLWGINPANGAPVIQEHTNAGEPNHFPTPTVADGLLIMPTTDQLYAWEGPAGAPHG